MPAAVCFLVLSLILAVTNAVAQPTKRALIIAIGGYDLATTGWSKLASLNDVPFIQTALQKQGFLDQNIAILTDANASQIITALEKFNQTLLNGDIGVIHYSGHGVQLQDDNGDEPDRLDEALVPLGASYKPEELNSSHYLRDDILGRHIVQIRQKLGKEGHLLLFLDSCHSGASTRSSETPRGGLPPLITPQWQITPSNGVASSLADTPVATKGDAPEMAKFVVFAGASSNENNYETTANGQPVGSLSYTIGSVLGQLKATDTYRQVFAKIRAEMAIIAPRQSPILEGDADYLFFSGQSVHQQPYIELKKVLNSQTVQLNAGTVAGINQGDSFALYPAGTITTQNTPPLTEGKVTTQDYFSASVQLEQPLPDGFKAAQCWAFRTQQSFEHTAIKVATSFVGLQSPIQQQLLDSLRQWPFVSVVSMNQPFDICLKNTLQTTLVGAFIDDLPYIGTKPININSADGIRLLKKTIQSAAQVKLMKALRLTSEKIVVEMTLVRAKLDANETVTQVFDMSTDTLTRRFSEKDNMVIKLTNKGTQTAYYNIVVIQPDLQIIPIAPALNDSNDPNSYKIGAGETIFLKNRPLLGFSPPYGTEIMKLFATPQPINLLAAIEAQRELTLQTRDNGNPLLQLIKQYHTRGTSNPNLGSTFDYVYTITPNQ